MGKAIPFNKDDTADLIDAATPLLDFVRRKSEEQRAKNGIEADAEQITIVSMAMAIQTVIMADFAQLSSENKSDGLHVSHTVDEMLMRVEGVARGVGASMAQMTMNDDALALWLLTAFKDVMLDTMTSLRKRGRP